MKARPRSAGFLILAAVLATLLALPAVALADNEPAGKIDTSVQTVLEATGGAVAIPVMVQAPGALDQVRAEIPLGVDITEIPLVDSVAAFLTPQEIAALGASPFVSYIVADNMVHGLSYQSTMDITNLTIGLGDVASPAAGGPDGAGVTVAILDSGIATTTDLGAGRIVGWKDFVDDQPLPYDDAGHGTFVAGVIAGDGTASLPTDGGSVTVQFRGVAPAADVVGIKVLDEVGQGRASDLIAGIAWAIAHKDEYGIEVMNVSIGGNPVASVSKDPVARAVEAAWQSGITVVCAAGNEGEFGPGSILSPGNDPFVITVGADDTQQTATTSDDAIAPYSSVGPTLFDEIVKPDVVAPGQRVVSMRSAGSFIDVNFPQNIVPLADYTLSPPPGTESAYVRLSGTSTSAPVVAGAAALLLGEDPSLTPDDVKVRLMQTADLVAGADNYRQGAGLIDVDEALASSARATGWALSPVDSGGKKKVFTEGEYNKWEKRSWEKWGWTKYKWTKYKWTKYKWTKYKWTEIVWTKYKWTKYKWTEYDWAKYKWTTLIEGR